MIMFLIVCVSALKNAGRAGQLAQEVTFLSTLSYKVMLVYYFTD